MHAARRWHHGAAPCATPLAAPSALRVPRFWEFVRRSMRHTRRPRPRRGVQWQQWFHKWPQQDWCETGI
eukprot:4485069-Prymnesium_polylepis.1